MISRDLDQAIARVIPGATEFFYCQSSPGAIQAGLANLAPLAALAVVEHGSAFGAPWLAAMTQMIFSMSVVLRRMMGASLRRGIPWHQFGGPSAGFFRWLSRLLGFRESRRLWALYLGRLGSMADELDRDVQALRNWLRDAWRYLANNPTLTPFDRREFRNTMKQVESTLRTAITQLAAQEKARTQNLPPPSERALMPGFRLLTSVDVKDVRDAAA